MSDVGELLSAARWLCRIALLPKRRQNRRLKSCILARCCASVLFVLLVGLGVETQGQSCIPLPANIVAWWRAENNLSDTISGKAGIVGGNETFGSGKVGLGFLGDGLGDGVLITNTSALELQTLT